MEYEIVNLEEKKAVGISAVTNNKSPEMPKIIGGLWDEFYKKVYGEINDKTNNKSIGMYHKYQPNGDYTVSICAEVNSTNHDGAPHDRGRPDGGVQHRGTFKR